MTCTRCGRESNEEDRCYATTSASGEALPSSIHYRAAVEDAGGVYVLRLRGRDGRGGQYYVGKATDVPRRVAVHQRGSTDSAAWVNHNNGVAAVEEPYTPRGDDLGAWEMRETIDRMTRHGIDNVRGWEWTSTRPLTRDDYASIRLVACGVLDCCRACGQRGHYVKACVGNRMVEPWMRCCDDALAVQPVGSSARQIVASSAQPASMATVIPEISLGAKSASPRATIPPTATAATFSLSHWDWSATRPKWSTELSRVFGTLGDAVRSLTSVPSGIVARDLKAINESSENDNATLIYHEAGTTYRITHYRERSWLWHKCRVLAARLRAPGCTM
jgi:hypothetical protein